MCLEKKKGGRRMAGEWREDQMGNSGSEPDRDLFLKCGKNRWNAWGVGHKEDREEWTWDCICVKAKILQGEIRGDRERQRDLTTDRGTASLTYDRKLVPSLQHSVLNTQDKTQSLSCRLQTVNQTHPSSPYLTLPHGPLQGVGGEVRREGGMLGWRLKKCVGGN